MGVADKIVSSMIVHNIANQILALAYAAVPVDTGSLMDSGRVDEFDTCCYCVSFGNGPVNGVTREGRHVYRPEIEYATYIHEHGGIGGFGAKFLENAAQAIINMSSSFDVPIAMKLSLGETIDGNKWCVAVYVYDIRFNDGSEVPGDVMAGSAVASDSDDVYELYDSGNMAEALREIQSMVNTIVNNM